MKCDTCIFKQHHHGAGAPDDYSVDYCDKGHWENSVPDPDPDDTEFFEMPKQTAIDLLNYLNSK